MAYEVINSAQVTPARMQALLRLVCQLKKPRRQDLLDLLQPISLVGNQQAAEEVFRAAVSCDLLQTSAVSHEDDGLIQPQYDCDAVRDPVAYRKLMQSFLLGVTNE